MGTRTQVVLVLIGLSVISGTATAIVLLAWPNGDSPSPSEARNDCTHVDQALRKWSAVMPDIQSALAGEAESSLSHDTATAATKVRRKAEPIENPELKATVIKLASQLDLVSRGNPSAAPIGFPDQDYVRGYKGMIETVRDLKIACPEAGD